MATVVATVAAMAATSAATLAAAAVAVSSAVMAVSAMWVVAARAGRGGWSLERVAHAWKAQPTHSRGDVRTSHDRFHT
jgi:hypothetical protein